jgi:hypothetical protein
MRKIELRLYENGILMGYEDEAPKVLFFETTELKELCEILADEIKENYA